MNIAEIRAIARDAGIQPLPKSKLTLVRTIQVDEGNFPCFGTAFDGVCDQLHCLWRSDCFKAAAASPKAAASTTRRAPRARSSAAASA